MILPTAGIYYRQMTVDGWGLFKKDSEVPVYVYKDVVSPTKIGWIFSDKVKWGYDFPPESKKRKELSNRSPL